MLDASVIVVNYRSEGHAVQLIRELSTRREECPGEILLVDNSPERGLGESAEARLPAVQYIPMEQNVGFAAAVNRGLEQATGEIVILLNPDARPLPGCLSGLVQVLRSEPGAAIAGARLVPFEEGEPEVPSATWTEPSLWTCLIEYTAVRRLIPGGRDWLSRCYFVNEPEGAEPVECAMVQGACFAFLKSAADWLGGFDAERFFLYWEETDFCRRVREQGGKVLFCPGLLCRHFGGASVGPERQAAGHYWRGFYAYHRKYYGREYTWLLRILLAGGMAAECLILEAIRLWRGGRDAQLAADLERQRALLREQF